MSFSRWAVPLLFTVCTSCAGARQRVMRSLAVRADAPAETPATLRVPYVAQSELLCGGAAIAMIERWWGRRGVYAEDFRDLVRPDSGGILTTDMSRVMRGRGWHVEALSGGASRARQAVADSEPVIALIRVAENRYHYVVIVRWSDASVTYHDPAVSPSIRVDTPRFMRQWDGADRWMMLVRPADGATHDTAVVGRSVTASPDSLPCRPYLDQAADAASARDLVGADRLLARAVTACPAEALVLRELAGVRFRQGNQAEATRLATAYVRRAPNDSLGWQLLASSRYLTGDERGALAAWNVIGRPTVDLLRIDGSRRVRFRTLADATGIAQRRVLTSSRYAMATRRIADVPALASAHLSYIALAAGKVEVRGVVDERPLIPSLPSLAVATAVRAIGSHDAILAVSTPLGVGDRWTAYWRWEKADPRVALRLDIPSHVVVPGIVTLERSWDRYRFAASIPGERRSASSIAFTSWLHPDIEQRTAARFERWSDAGDFFALSLGAGAHTPRDRIVLTGEAEHGVALGGNAPYDRVRVRSAWTAPSALLDATWSLRIGNDWSSARTPRGLWAVAGGNLARDIPLRAHPVIVDDVFPSARTSRQVLYGGIAGDRGIASLGPLAIGAGVFVDGAHVVLPGDATGKARLYLDGGVGVRAGLDGSRWPQVRVDIARGLVTDRRWGLTASLVRTTTLRLGRPSF